MLPAHVRAKLDFSSDSLDVLEAWLLDRYPTFDALKPMSESRIMDGAARYIGETYRNGLPQIKGPGDAPPICPLALAREAIAEPRGPRGGSHLHAALRDRRALVQPVN